MNAPLVSPIAKPSESVESQLPWWRYRILWLVVGGPLLVVVASLFTAAIAIKGADKVLTESEMRSTAPGQSAESMMPAIQARNHAAAPKK